MSYNSTAGFHFGPTLETSRLLLRPLSGEDFPGFVELMSDPLSAHHIGGVQPRSMAWRLFSTMVGAWPLLGYSMFSVIEKQSGRWIGRVGPWQAEGWPGTEVGWGLIRDAWGKGYATEAARVCMAWAFDSLGWDEVIHCIDPTNAPSQEVAKRLGSTILRMGRMPAPYDKYEIEIWGQSKEQWKQHRYA